MKKCTMSKNFITFRQCNSNQYNQLLTELCKKSRVIKKDFVKVEYEIYMLQLPLFGRNIVQYLIQCFRSKRGCFKRKKNILRPFIEFFILLLNFKKYKFWNLCLSKYIITRLIRQVWLECAKNIHSKNFAGNCYCHQMITKYMIIVFHVILKLH